MGGHDLASILQARGRRGLWDAVHHPIAVELLAPHGEAAGVGPVLVRVADVDPRPVRWLWPGRVPAGKLTVLDGDPNRGKSLLTLDVAARVSTGREMPDGTRGDLDEPAGVVILSAEDDIADTIRPRLDAAGADLARVACLRAVREADGRERTITLADVSPLSQAIGETGAALVIVDPLAAYLGSDTDSHRDAAIRGLLAPLAEMAARTGAALLVVRHLRKAESPSAIYAGGGSIGIIGAARSGLLAAADPDDATGERRLLAPTKCNLAPQQATLAYRVVAHGAVARVEWLGPSDRTADELVRPPSQGADDARSRMDEAMSWLRAELAEGPRAAAEVSAAARRARIAPRTLRRAREQLGVQTLRDGDATAWRWHLPECSPGATE